MRALESLRRLRERRLGQRRRGGVTVHPYTLVDAHRGWELRRTYEGEWVAVRVAHPRAGDTFRVGGPQLTLAAAASAFRAAVAAREGGRRGRT